MSVQITIVDVAPYGYYMKIEAKVGYFSSLATAIACDKPHSASFECDWHARI